MEFPDQLRYTKEHEWVAVEDGRARVGITDFEIDVRGKHRPAVVSTRPLYSKETDG